MPLPANTLLKNIFSAVPKIHNRNINAVLRIGLCYHNMIQCCYAVGRTIFLSVDVALCNNDYLSYDNHVLFVFLQKAGSEK